MFGYVKPDISELKVKEYDAYRAVYCGLCRAMGEVTGQLSRMSLSYDFTFYAAVRMVLTGEEPEIRPMRCPVHPLRKRYIVRTDPALETAADQSVILTWWKLSDTADDANAAEAAAAAALLAKLEEDR